MGVVISVGSVFGYLTVVRAAPSDRYGRRWVVLCTCGASKEAPASSLRKGSSTSCGSCAHKKHGMAKTPTYVSWRSMIERCTSETSKDYPRYGGRGITVCARWLKFENFLEDMGARPEGKTLDRFPNKNGNYEPGNCRWATCKEQSLNTKSVILLELDGVSDSVAGWASRVGISPGSMAKRLKKWPLHRALTEKPRSY